MFWADLERRIEESLLSILWCGTVVPILVLMASKTVGYLGVGPGAFTVYLVVVAVSFKWLGLLPGWVAVGMSTAMAAYDLPPTGSLFVLPEYQGRLLWYLAAAALIGWLATPLRRLAPRRPEKPDEADKNGSPLPPVVVAVVAPIEAVVVGPWHLLDKKPEEAEDETARFAVELEGNVVHLRGSDPSPLRIVQQSETVERALGVTIENIILLKMFWKALTGESPEQVDLELSQEVLEQKLAGFTQGKEAFEQVAGLSIAQALLLKTVWEGFSLGSVQDISREQMERAVLEIGGAKLEIRFRTPAVPPILASSASHADGENANSPSAAC